MRSFPVGCAACVWWTSDEYKNDNHPASQKAQHTAQQRTGTQGTQRVSCVDQLLVAEGQHADHGDGQHNDDQAERL